MALRLLGYLIVALISVFFIMIAIGNIRLEVASANIVSMARPIEESADISGGFLDTVAVTSLVDAASTSCIDDLSRAATTLKLGLLDQALKWEAPDRVVWAAAAASEAAVNVRLKCSPTDGNAWLLRARLLEYRYDRRPAVLRALRLSYHLAPAEKWIITPRIAFAAKLVEVGELSMLDEFKQDIDRMADFYMVGEIALAYVDAPVPARPFFVPAIRRQPLERRSNIVRLIDYLGVSFPRSAECISKLVQPNIPGSELLVRRPDLEMRDCEQ